jgi:hypothetical protein
MQRSDVGTLHLTVYAHDQARGWHPTNRLHSVHLEKPIPTR